MKINIFRPGVFIIGHGGAKTRVNSRSELGTFPLFLRFNNVQLFYFFNALQTIEHTCDFFESYLLPNKPAFIDSNMVEFYAGINRIPTDFSDHSHLLDYIRNRFLSIFDSSRGYLFKCCVFSDTDFVTNVAASILEIPKVKRCANIVIEISCGMQKQLPVEAISNWLEIDVQNKQEKFLEVELSTGIQSARVMLEHMTTV